MLLPSDVDDMYNENGEIKLFVGMLDVLAFLQVDDVADDMKHIRDN